MPLEEFEGGAATGGDVLHPVDESRLLHRGSAVAAAHHGDAGDSAMARATPNVPSAQAFCSKSPMGPFQKTVFAAEDPLPVPVEGLRADVEPHESVGNGGAVHDHPLGGLLRLGAADVVHRQLEVDPLDLGLVEDLPGQLELVLLHAALPTGTPLAARKV